jgi:hypothetical protein
MTSPSFTVLEGPNGKEKRKKGKNKNLTLFQWTELEK